MMQIVHDIAPDASLAFYTAFDGEHDFADRILSLAADALTGRPLRGRPRSATSTAKRSVEHSDSRPVVATVAGVATMM